MKKKLIWILCLLGIFLFIPIPVSTTGSAPLLVDHADLLTGILHGLNVESNREAGDGRFDICIIPSGNHNTGIVIERKHSKSAVDLPKDSRSAAEQIVERHYLQDSKFSACRHTKGYGMAFHKKRCFVTGIDEL